MKVRVIKFSKAILVLVVLSVCTIANAQVKYDSNGKLTIGNTTPYEFYGITAYGGGIYLKSKTSNFFQIDVTPAATRLASHYDQVVFYNTVIVTNGAKLTFNAGESVTINTPFTVNAGSQIEISAN